MKRFTIIGLFTMLYATNFSSPSSDFVLIKGGSSLSKDVEKWLKKYGVFLGIKDL